MTSRHVGPNNPMNLAPKQIPPKPSPDFLSRLSSQSSKLLAAIEGTFRRKPPVEDASARDAPPSVLDRLPPEILLLVLPYLSNIKDLYRLSRVSRAAHILVSDFFENLPFVDIPPEYPRSRLPFLFSRGFRPILRKSMRYIKLREWNTPKKMTGAANIFAEIRRLFSRTQATKLDEDESECPTSLAFIIRRCPNIFYLDLLSSSAVSVAAIPIILGLVSPRSKHAMQLEDNGSSQLTKSAHPMKQLKMLLCGCDAELTAELKLRLLRTVLAWSVRDSGCRIIYFRWHPTCVMHPQEDEHQGLAALNALMIDAEEQFGQDVIGERAVPKGETLSFDVCPKCHTSVEIFFQALDETSDLEAAATALSM